MSDEDYNCEDDRLSDADFEPDFTSTNEVKQQLPGTTPDSGKKARELTIADKKSVVVDAMGGMSQRALAKKYNVSKTQIQRIMARKMAVLESPVEASNKRRFTNTTKFPALEQKLVEYLIEYKKANKKDIKKKKLIEKAMAISAEENLKFLASSGWYAGFKRRHNIISRNRKIRRNKAENGVKAEDDDEELVKGEPGKVMETYEVVVDDNGVDYEIFVAGQANASTEDNEAIEIIETNDYDLLPTGPTGQNTLENVPELMDLDEQIREHETPLDIVPQNIIPKKIKRERKKRTRRLTQTVEPEIEKDADGMYIIPELNAQSSALEATYDTEPPELLDEINATSIYPTALEASPHTRRIHSTYSMFRNNNTNGGGESSIKIRVKYEKNQSTSSTRSKQADNEQNNLEQITPDEAVPMTPPQPPAVPLDTNINQSPVVSQQQDQEIQVVQPQSIEEVLGNGVQLSDALSILTLLRSNLEFRDKKDYNEFYTKISPAIEHLQLLTFKYQLDDLKTQLSS
jgi:Tc5 transposase DNA-binding domain/CENP-B N-terminal DNA-binding domain